MNRINPFPEELQTPLEWLRERQNSAAKQIITDAHVFWCVWYMEELEGELEFLRGVVDAAAIRAEALRLAHEMEANFGAEEEI